VFEASTWVLTSWSIAMAGGKRDDVPGLQIPSSGLYCWCGSFNLVEGPDTILGIHHVKPGPKRVGLGFRLCCGAVTWWLGVLYGLAEQQDSTMEA